MKNILLFGVLLVFLGCSSEPGSSGNSSSGPKVTPEGKKYSSLPNDQYTALFKHVTNIDFIAYTANLSMSFDDPNSVRTILQYISKEATILPDHCEKTVRVTFISDGNIYKEADVYAYDGCSAFVFYENGMATYANMIDPLGVEFFQRYIPKEDPAAQPQQ